MQKNEFCMQLNLLACLMQLSSIAHNGLQIGGRFNAANVLLYAVCFNFCAVEKLINLINKI